MLGSNVNCFWGVKRFPYQPKSIQCFSVSETVVEIGESVRGRDVYIIQTGTKSAFPCSFYGHSTVCDFLLFGFRVLFFVDCWVEGLLFFCI